jgi:ABC-type Mn2+/Zn2+ transport system ATPase subunit
MRNSDIQRAERFNNHDFQKCKRYIITPSRQENAQMELTVENLTIGFGGTILFSDLSATLKSGETLAVLGCNGTGKSSFLKVLTGFAKPSRGKIIVQGDESAPIPTIGYLAQTNNINQEIPISVFDFVDLGTLAIEKPRHEFKPKHPITPDAALALVGIATLSKKLIGHLSTGQFVKACLARCLIADPDIIILDEPFASLDTISCEEIRILLENLKSQGKIIIVSIHDEKLSIGFDHFVTLSGISALWENRLPTHSHQCELHECKTEIGNAA